MRSRDIKDKVYNELYVLEYIEERGKYDYWKCECSCGRQTVVRGNHIVNGSVKSCGCLVGKVGEGFTSHGLSKNPVYSIWKLIKARCYNPNAGNYKYYGARGISMCGRWLHNPELFINDMGLRPEGYSIDRIDNDGNYEPSNCRWVDHKTQCQNRRSPDRKRI